MKDGIYFVAFSSNQQDFGSGTVVIKDSVINGGDFGFTYQGYVKDNNMHLHIFQHDPTVTAVFPGLKDFKLHLNIQGGSNQVHLSGGVEAMPGFVIDIRAKWIGSIYQG